jgi:hypothetical protein
VGEGLAEVVGLAAVGEALVVLGAGGAGGAADAGVRVGDLVTGADGDDGSVASGTLARMSSGWALLRDGVS